MREHPLLSASLPPQLLLLLSRAQLEKERVWKGMLNWNPGEWEAVTPLGEEGGIWQAASGGLETALGKQRGCYGLSSLFGVLVALASPPALLEMEAFCCTLWGVPQGTLLACSSCTVQPLAKLQSGEPRLPGQVSCFLHSKKTPGMRSPFTKHGAARYGGSQAGGPRREYERPIPKAPGTSCSLPSVQVKQHCPAAPQAHGSQCAAWGGGRQPCLLVPAGYWNVRILVAMHSKGCVCDVVPHQPASCDLGRGHHSAAEPCFTCRSPRFPKQGRGRPLAGFGESEPSAQIRLPSLG